MVLIASSGQSEYGFYIDLEDVEVTYSVEITPESGRARSGRRRDDLWHEFNHYREVKINELHPQLSNSILDSTGIYPYSKRSEVETNFLSKNGLDALRVADSTKAHYYFLEEPDEISPDYLND
ncbi:MAG: hypothetical protein ACI8Z7_000405 [Candidatus Nanohaloarchaea archaeon]